jgi:hypothetical protein
MAKTKVVKIRRKKKPVSQQVTPGPRIGKPPRLVVVRLNVQGEVQEKRLSQLTKDEREYFQSLHAVIDQIYQEAAEVHHWTWSDLAVMSGLNYATIVKLGERETRWPRFQTIYRLAKAVGWELVAHNPKAKRKTAQRRAG